MILAIKGLELGYNYGRVEESFQIILLQSVITLCVPLMPRINRGITNYFPVTCSSWIRSLQFSGFEEPVTSHGKRYYGMLSSGMLLVYYVCFSLSLNPEFIMR